MEKLVAGYEATPHASGHSKLILRCTREGRGQTRLLEDVVSSLAERAIGRCLTVRIVSEAVTTWMQSDPEGVH